MPALHVTYSAVACPYCKRGVGMKCVDGFGRDIDEAHYSRKGLAMELRNKIDKEEQRKKK